MGGYRFYRSIIMILNYQTNNKEITIENKSIFWAHLIEKGICFVHDLLDENGKFLSLDDLQVKCNVHLNFFSIFSTYCCNSKLLEENSSRNCRNEKRPILFRQQTNLLDYKLRCKDHYNLFQEGKTTEPTSFKRWSSFFLQFASS